MGIYDRATREKVVLASGNIFLNVMGECSPRLGGTRGERAAGVSGWGDSRDLAHFPIPRDEDGDRDRDGDGNEDGDGDEDGHEDGDGDGWVSRMPC